uniref:N-acetyltransferase domain-containing protein n=1 Tax=Parastrongyloides trichosuri TaxID=131310 RepID=A0A0N4ZR35_PARTI
MMLSRKRIYTREKESLERAADLYKIENVMESEPINKRVLMEKNYMYKGFLQEVSCNFIKIENVKDDNILNVLREDADFVPLSIETLDFNTITFIVSSENEANDLVNLSGRITYRNQIINIQKKPANYRLWDNLTDKDIENIFEVCGKRYNPVKNALDLSNLHHESVFNDPDSTGATLSKIDVVLIITRFIKEDCPNVEKISFSSNGLRSLECLQPILHVAKNVNCIDISFNLLNNIKSFAVLKRFKLKEIYLKEFQSDKFFHLDEEIAYEHIAELLKTSILNYNTLKEVEHIPKLNYTDFSDFSLCFQYEQQFDAADDIYQSFFNNDIIVEDAIKNFFQSYILIFDENYLEDRKTLKKYYRKNGKFSLIASPILDGRRHQYCYGKDQLKKKDNAVFLAMTHNMRKPQHYSDNLEDVLFVGRENIIKGLLMLPPSKHDFSTFVFDVSYIDINVIMFSVQGLVNFGQSKNEQPNNWFSDDIKIFSRSFVCSIESHKGIRIVSDLMTIYPSSEPALKWYKTQLRFLLPLENKDKKICGKNEYERQCEDEQLVLNLQQMTLKCENDEKYKQMLIERFSRETSMRQAYSYKCLRDNGMDYKKALNAFNYYKHTLKPAAFIKL